MNLRMRGRKIFAFFQQHPQGSLQQAARETRISKTAAFRHKQAMARRNQHPESWVWETEVGWKWLALLVCATIYLFGIRGGIGMDTLAEFFVLIRVNTHVGLSATSLARLTAHIETLILQYQQAHPYPDATGIQVIAGADETFFDRVILVLMDLDSGFIIVEETAEDRTFLTWQERVRHALTQVGVSIRCLVSDQASALSKLALEELQCRKIPDLFHALHEVVKLFGARFARQLVSLQRKIAKTQLTLEGLRQQERGPEQLARHEQTLAALRAAHTRMRDGQTRYYEALHAVSLLVHPFSLDGQRPQSATEVDKAITHTLATLRSLAEEFEIADSKQRLKKVEKQVPDIAAQVDLWWNWVREALASYSLPTDLEDWLGSILLPSVYWHTQATRSSPGSLRVAYEKASVAAQQRLDGHALTRVLAPKELSRWRYWAVWIVGKFQRTSSAVEGRNGVLSRMNHTQRSIRPRRLKVATIIHNLGIRREDGTTAAERLFGESFPDLFTWLVEHMGELPTPRDRRASAS